MSSAAVRVSLPSPTHGQPAGPRLWQMLSLSPGPAPVPALLHPELHPVGMWKPCVPSRRTPPGLLLLSATHAWRCSFCFRRPRLWHDRWWDRRPPQAPGGNQPSVHLASLVCCPPITLPGVWQPVAPLPRPASPLSHTVMGHRDMETKWHSMWFTLRRDYCLWSLNQGQRNQD